LNRDAPDERTPVIDKLAVTAKIMVTLKKLPDGKIRLCKLLGRREPSPQS
jgi:hypothetical protein